jgi:hypothetical protein
MLIKGMNGTLIAAGADGIPLEQILLSTDIF